MSKSNNSRGNILTRLHRAVNKAPAWAPETQAWEPNRLTKKNGSTCSKS